MNAARIPEHGASLPAGGAPDDRTSDDIIEAIARRIVARRLEAPAVLFLEMHKPLAFLAGQAAVVATPLLSLFAAPADVERARCALGSQQGVESLIARIETLASERPGDQLP